MKRRDICSHSLHMLLCIIQEHRIESRDPFQAESPQHHLQCIVNQNQFSGLTDSFFWEQTNESSWWFRTRWFLQWWAVHYKGRWGIIVHQHRCTKIWVEWKKLIKRIMQKQAFQNMKNVLKNETMKKWTSPRWGCTLWNWWGWEFYFFCLLVVDSVLWLQSITRRT